MSPGRVRGPIVIDTDVYGAELVPGSKTVFDPDRAIQKRAVCGRLINEFRQAA